MTERPLAEFGIAKSDEKYAGNAIWQRYAQTWEHEYFASLVRGAYGMIPDGETAAGHQKFRLPTPEESVSVACELMDRMLAESHRRGYLVERPTWAEMKEDGSDFQGFMPRAVQR